MKTQQAIPRGSLIILLLIVAPLIVFGPAVHYGFVGWDDDIHVYANRYLASLAPGNIVHFWSSPHEAMYIPVTFTAWAFLAALSRFLAPAGAAFGLYPAVFHHANLILHLLNVFLLYGIIKILFRGSSTDQGRIEWSAALGALLFALHPVQVEPVVWISSLKDVLCGFFSLLALRNYIRYAQAVEINRELPGVNRRQRKRYGVYATAAFALALLSKPAAVPVVAIGWLLVHFRWREEQLTGRRGFPKTLFFPPFTLLLLWLVMTLPVILMARFSEQEIPLGYVAPLPARFLLALDAVALYLYKLFIPLQLGIDYGRTPARVMEQGWLYYSWLLPAVIGASVLFLKDRRHWLIILGVFTAGLLPVLGLVPHGYQVFSTVADRFLYLSMIAPALALSWVFLRHRRRAAGGVCIAIPVVCSALSFLQVRHWSENGSLFQHALRVNPASYMAHYNLGMTRAGEGKPAEAISHYRRAIEIKPDYGRAHNNLGAILTEQGSFVEAIPYYAEAYRLEPGNQRAFFNLYSAYNDLGLKLAEKGDLPSAVGCYREALRLHPAYVAARNNLGNALAARGELEEAAGQYREAIRLNPGYAMAYNNLGTVYARQGRREEAENLYIRALRIEPGLAEARKNLSLIFSPKK
ncbi:MAG: tetratricopeptide repeat protein [PVC group bacterium]